VPYKSSTQVLTDMVSGQIHIYCAAAPSLPSLLAAGKVRPLGSTYRHQSPLAPGVPPIADTLPGFELLGWYGLEVPLHTPKPLIAKINGDFTRVLRDAGVRERLVAIGAEPAPNSPEAFGAFLRRETERWAKLIKQGGDRPDLTVTRKGPE
jgi:tripartite-type tricarboxylate transporter receptor subunit TctC